ncbi:MAG: hypothetical protein AABY10_03995, partial [Nanoarchaeota archaeon]
HSLDKQGYIEQYWLQELRKVGGESDLKIAFEEALKLSEKYGISLHPDFIFYWREIDNKYFLDFLDWLSHSEIREGKLVLPYKQIDKERFARGKRALELIGCEHIIATEDVVVNVENSKSVLFNLGIENLEIKMEEAVDLLIKKLGDNIKEEKDGLYFVNLLSRINIRDKSGTFIGSRMGRPEKAKLRKLIGSPHVLFPVGEEGGRLRSFQAALEAGSVKSDFCDYFCKNCKENNVYNKCIKCGEFCEKMYFCRKCDRSYFEKCPEHNEGSEYKSMRINIRDYFESARKAVGIRNDEISLIKGVRGTSNRDHTAENLSKGILRAKHNLHVNKDGTIRYDMSEMPLTHFKPKEIGTSIQKLKELGYGKDVYGKTLENDDQVLEIFPHDVILPASPETLDEKADDVFLKISKFVDDELEKIYGLPRFFNAETREDIVGALLGCIAPHNCAAVVGRLIGFSKTQALLASPYMHAAMRRD